MMVVFSIVPMIKIVIESFCTHHLDPSTAFAQVCAWLFFSQRASDEGQVFFSETDPSYRSHTCRRGSCTAIHTCMEAAWEEENALDIDIDYALLTALCGRKRKLTFGTGNITSAAFKLFETNDHSTLFVWLKKCKSTNVLYSHTFGGGIC